MQNIKSDHQAHPSAFPTTWPTSAGLPAFVCGACEEPAVQLTCGLCPACAAEVEAVCEERWVEDMALLALDEEEAARDFAERSGWADEVELADIPKPWAL